MTFDLFDTADAQARQWQEPLAPGALVLRGFVADAVPILAAVHTVIAQAPLRHMVTPGGHRMSVTTTSCGALGWVSDDTGYRYDAIDPATGRAWPVMPGALVALAVFLGHLYPVFFRFIGGKGVATAAGVLFALNPWLGLGLLVIWLVLAVGLKLSSLAALAATAVALPLAWWLAMPGAYLATIGAIGVLLVWRHRSNIRKLLSGTESGFGGKAGKEDPTAQP
ncbi:MAG: glycerol-3-phosphate acyltransferase [Proteobacteria bacterium]|nr:glycerol-3-phosphate acyltransferase [Pseudomonadota bacterium]